MNNVVQSSRPGSSAHPGCVQVLRDRRGLLAYLAAYPDAPAATSRPLTPSSSRA